jgi:transcriptional regulator with XRE-family HTH domain
MGSELEKRIGQKVATYRNAAGLTQEQLALAVSVVPDTISRLERGVQILTFKKLNKIAEVLSVDIFDLFDFKKEETKKDTALNELILELKFRETEDIELIRDIADRIFRGKKSKK